MPGPIDETWISLGSLELPISGGSDQLISLPIPHCGSPFFLGAVDYNELTKDTAALGYLSEIWQTTAAREQATTINAARLFIDKTQVTISGTDIRQILLDFNTLPKGGFSEGNTTPACDYGYAQFHYGQGDPELVHISFQQTKLMPPLPLCTGVDLFLREKLSGSYVTYDNSSGAPQIVCDGTKPVSPSTNVMTGLGNFGTSLGTENNQSAPGGTFTYPKCGFGWSFASSNQTAIIDNNTTIGSGIFLTAVTGYLVESWQDIVQPTFGQAEGPTPIMSLDTVYPTVLGNIKSAKLVVTPATPARSELNWRFGLPIYGAWAAKYGNYFGKVRYLNSLTNFLVPEGRGCTGLWLFLKQGCTGSLSTQETAGQTQGTSTPDGSVNMTAGDYTGLFWST